MPYAVFLHCIVALWMFSNARIFQSDEDVANQLASFNGTKIGSVMHYQNEVGEGVPPFDATTSREVWGRVTRPQVAVLLAFIATFGLVIVARSVLLSAAATAGRALLPCLARIFGYAPTSRSSRGLPNYFDGEVIRTHARLKDLLLTSVLVLKAIPTPVLAVKLARPNVLLPRRSLREKYELTFERRRQQGISDPRSSPVKKSPRKLRAMSAAEHLSAANWIVGCPSYGAYLKMPCLAMGASAF